MARRVHTLFTQATEPACPTCAFALRGLSERGNCPECGGAYEPATSLPLIPPSPLRALGFVATPLALGALCVAAGFVLGSNTRDEFWAITMAVAAAILTCASVVWSSWRAIVLIDALHRALPTHRQERTTTRAFGCVGTGLAGLIGVVAFGAGAVLTILLGSCLLEGMPNLH